MQEITNLRMRTASSPGPKAKVEEEPAPKKKPKKLKKNERRVQDTENLQIWLNDKLVHVKSASDLGIKLVQKRGHWKVLHKVELQYVPMNNDGIYPSIPTYHRKIDFDTVVKVR